MSATVSATETNTVRVVALGTELCKAVKSARTLAPLRNAIGVEALDPAQVQLIEMDALTPMSLRQFLAEAYEVEEATLLQHKSQLDTLQDDCAVIRSAAFLNKPVMLKFESGARLVATFSEPETDWSAQPIEPVSSARPYSGRANAKVTNQTARVFRMGRIIIVAMIALMAAIWMLAR